MRGVVASALLLLLASGCTSAPKADFGDPGPRFSDPRDVTFDDTGTAVALHLEDCVEFGASYPLPSGLFTVPTGFAVTETSAGQTFLLEVIYQCTTGKETVQEQLLMIPVDPPAELADPEATFEVLLLAGVSEGLADLHDAWGFGDALVPGTVEIIAKLDIGEGSRWGGTTDGWSTETHALVIGEIGPGDAGRARVYHPSEPEKMLQVRWTGFETKIDGEQAAGRFVRVPGLLAPAAQGTPFFRGGPSYEWWIEPVRAV